jgi:4a-hydroxytetrahydrobiopterin dehydratase
MTNINQSPTPLAADELQKWLSVHPHWKLNSAQKLHREIKFKDFKEAFAFMQKIAVEAERLQHHPEWFNVYNRVEIELVTHDAGNAVSALDIKMANFIDQLAP